MKSILQFSLLMCIATVAQAHTGTHEPGLLKSLWHLATEPDHLLLLLLVVMPVALFMGVKQKRNLSRVKVNK